MAGPRKPPPRGPQQRNAVLEEEPAMRTRYGRGVKSTPTKAESAGISKASPHHANGSLEGKRRRRYFSPSSSPETRGPHAEYIAPNLIIRGLPTQFLQDLADKEERNQRKQRLYAGQFTQSDLENETSSDESDVQTPPPTSGRGRGRGGRGGRPRGRGRGRGRGTAAASSRHSTSISPLRTRKPRGRQPSHHSEEEDGEDESTNQSAEIESAKPSPPPDEDTVMNDAPDGEEDDDHEINGDAVLESHTPAGSPPPALPSGSQEVISRPPSQPAPSIPTINIAQNSASQTPQNGTSTSTGVATPVLQLINPEDDILSDSDLPGPWVEDYVPPATEAEAEDRADFLLQKRFKPLTDVETIISSLNKFNPAQRSTENLYRLAENTQRVLLEWQNEYLRLDKMTAPHMHPPKKPAHGGRVPLDPLVYEDMKEADLYGYIYDARKTPGTQDPFSQRPGAQKTGRRELRQRRGRDNVESGAPSEEEPEPENEPAVPGKRQRRATRRFEPTEPTSRATTPKKNTNGWGGARKRGVSKFAPAASETPEPDARPAKRQKVASKPLAHPRIQEMREESIVTTSGDEGSVQPEVPETPPQVVEEHRKRGRPAGSKNTGRRSDYGIKKGPRKKNVETPPAPASIAPAPVAGSPAPPTVLQSMSEGQGQFSLETRPSPAPQQHPIPLEQSHPAPLAMSQPVATVFQATPHPLNRPDVRAPLYLRPYNEEPAPSPVSVPKGVKPRVKSEKRSQSMTIWWAERKAKQKEMEAANAAAGGEVASPKADGSGTTSKGSTPKPPSRRNKATPRAEQPLQPYPDPSYMQHEQMVYSTPHPPPPPGLAHYPNPHLPPADHSHHPQHLHAGPPGPPHAPLPPLMQLHSIPSNQPLPPPPPGHAIVLHPSHLAALPTTTAPPPIAPAPHPIHHPAPPTQQRQMPAIAPAPGPIPQLKSYPSPYGARRGKGGAGKQPVPLMPAPSLTGYSARGAALETARERDMSFKVLVPGPPPQGGGPAGEAGTRG